MLLAMSAGQSNPSESSVRIVGPGVPGGCKSPPKTVLDDARRHAKAAAIVASFLTTFCEFIISMLLSARGPNQRRGDKQSH